MSFARASAPALMAAILVAAAGPASAQHVTGTFGLQAPGVYDFTLGALSTANVALADSFSLQAAPATVNGFNFVDVYTFTFTGYAGGASGSVISFSFFDPGQAISNLQIAIFEVSIDTFAAGQYLGQQGNTSGALNPWTSVPLSPAGSYSTFATPWQELQKDTSYAVQVRGLIDTTSAPHDGSYGGNLVITTVPISPVPEASSVALGIGGLAFLGLLRRRLRAAA